MAVPTEYLNWLIAQEWLRPDTANAVKEELRRRAEHYGTILDDLPRSEACVVCGVALDEAEAGQFWLAVEDGEMVLEPHTPCSSPVPDAWRRWCAANNLPHRVRQVRIDD